MVAAMPPLVLREPFAPLAATRFVLPVEAAELHSAVLEPA